MNLRKLIHGIGRLLCWYSLHDFHRKEYEGTGFESQASVTLTCSRCGKPIYGRKPPWGDDGEWKWEHYSRGVKYPYKGWVSRADYASRHGLLSATEFAIVIIVVTLGVSASLLLITLLARAVA